MFDGLRETIWPVIAMLNRLSALILKLVALSAEAVLLAATLMMSGIGTNREFPDMIIWIPLLWHIRALPEGLALTI